MNSERQLENIDNDKLNMINMGRTLALRVMSEYEQLVGMPSAQIDDDTRDYLVNVVDTKSYIKAMVLPAFRLLLGLNKDL